MRRLKSVLKVVGALLAVLVVGLVITGFVLHRDRVGGRAGAEADELARAMAESVNGAAWDATGAVRWNFRGKHEHLWDRGRGFAQVRWDNVDVRLRLSDQEGVALVDGTRVDGEAAAELRSKAYAFWVNDSFWLNPVVKAFDEGVTREALEVEGKRALLVRYASGGVTPGDEYLWILDDENRPIAWRMWVSILPVGGVEATWDGWTELSTGAVVATRHELLGFLTLELSDVEGAATLEALVDDDPFADL
ncbi:MAG: hypothetical protein AAGE52_23655 [Myxococcota bacterium]